ncbi:hypothetical protein BTR23_16745 [Alkalihalophilus pseudofirmus]|uniref:hypothetical protein n=1 Tax=Alkalihalobacterium alkalinitrilicum TaxID=427920 RepID=UPI00094D29B3|nr:hypothetical protein [Alkalihalobacterium alkalinitrilicum]OLO29021.1 hypothetical protein BTR23_16745 [Alkalihalophilus pseudofirmus]
MKFIPNFGEFYQKPLVPIGENDRILALEKLPNTELHEGFSHWLIALEGTEISQNSNFYQWRVLVYPAKKCGQFECFHPYFVSAYFPTMDDALTFTKEIEKRASQDQITQIPQAAS